MTLATTPPSAVVLLPGDGIGPLVTEQAVRVLEAVGFRPRWLHADVGWSQWREHGDPLPESTLALLREHRLGLFGAITSKPAPEAEAELRPSLQGLGLHYESPVLRLRRELALDVCLRPCRTLEGHPRNHVRRRGDVVEEPRVDALLVTQNNEGLYAGVEWRALPDELRRALDVHPAMRAFDDVPSAELSVSLRLLSRRAALRVAEVAFEAARARGERRLTVCDKWGVMRETSARLLAAVREVSERFPDVEVALTHADAQVMWLVQRPERFGVVLSSALVGDILSDGFAALVGGLGFAPSANVGAAHAIFEPAHGSAPRHATRAPPIVNPCAAILAGAMLLDHVGERERAEAVRGAVARVVRDGRARSYDMLALDPADDVIAQGAATTTQMGDAVIGALP